MSHDTKMEDVAKAAYDQEKMAADETRSDTINENLMVSIRNIEMILNDHSGEVRPWEASQLAGPFVDMMNLVTDLDSEILGESLIELRRLSGDAFGGLLLAMPIEEPTSHNLDQHLAVDVARVLGPDHAQNWYHFSVLVTKLA